MGKSYSIARYELKIADGKPHLFVNGKKVADEIFRKWQSKDNMQFTKEIQVRTKKFVGRNQAGESYLKLLRVPININDERWNNSNKKSKNEQDKNQSEFIDEYCELLFSNPYIEKIFNIGSLDGLCCVMAFPIDKKNIPIY